MAYKMTKVGSLDNETSNEFFCDTAEDLNKIPTNLINLGSVAVVIEDMEVFIANSNKEWKSMILASTDNEEGGEG